MPGMARPEPEGAARPAGRSPLTVCSDPNNLPFSNRQRQGFENKIIELVAQDLDAEVELPVVAPAARLHFAKPSMPRNATCGRALATGVDLAADDPPLLPLYL